MAFNQNSGYGQAMLANLYNQVGVFGNVHVVMNSSDTDEGNYQAMQDLFPVDTNGRVRFYTSLADAYTEAESNNNDVILLDANSTHSLSTGLAVTKNRIHFIGMDGGDRLVQQGAKVQLATGSATAYVLKDTGVRNSFRNIKFIQGSAEATALSVAQFGGEGTLVKNCSFVFGVVDNLDQTNAFEVINGCDSGTFINCTFGADTLLTSAARAVMSLDMVTASQEFKSNILKECNFIISSSSATAAFVRTAAITDILFTNLFDSCSFQASVDTAGGIALAEAAQTGTGVTKGTLNFAYPRAFNVTNFSTATGGRNAGIQIVAPLVVNTDVVGITPVAT